MPVIVMGNMCGMQREGITGHDVLCRAEEGSCYYWVRDTEPCEPLDKRQPEVQLPVRLRKRWVRVHRLSVHAGLQLALSWGQSRTLRRDLAALSSAATPPASPHGRNGTATKEAALATAEPITTTLSPETSALVRWYCGVTKHGERPTVDGALHGALERAKDAYGDDSSDEAFNWVMDDVLTYMNSSRLDTERMFVPGGGRISVQLDEQASAAVHVYARRTGADVRDVVNAAITAEVPHVNDQITGKESAWDDGPVIMADHTAAAARRRTGKDAPDAPVVESPLPEYKSEPPPFALHPDDVPALAKLGGAFGLSASAFWSAYQGNTLPGQERRWHDEDALERKLSKVIAFECRDPKLLALLEEAARFDRRTLKGMVARSLAGEVHCFEDDILVHPKTGEVIGDRLKMDRIKERGLQWGRHLQQAGERALEEAAANRDSLPLTAAAKPAKGGQKKKGGWS